MKIIDIQHMPGYNPAVTNGVDSIRQGNVSVKELTWMEQIDTHGAGFHDGEWVRVYRYYPWCIRHGAMLKVSKEGIWRCGELGCDNGCFQVQ